MLLLYKGKMSSNDDKLHILFGHFLIKNGFIINSTQEVKIIYIIIIRS
jgi:hypothetical protein